MAGRPPVTAATATAGSVAGGRHGPPTGAKAAGVAAMATRGQAGRVGWRVVEEGEQAQGNLRGGWGGQEGVVQRGAAMQRHWLQPQARWSSSGPPPLIFS